MEPQNAHLNENFWIYNVLAPGMSYTISLDFELWLTSLYLSSCQYSSKPSPPGLLLYRQSSKTSVAKHILLNLPKLCPANRVHLPYNFRSLLPRPDMSCGGRQDGYLNSSQTSFCNILRFKLVIPHLVHVLQAGEIWTVDYKEAYAALVKCCIEQVLCHEHCLHSLSFWLLDRWWFTS